MTELSEGPDQLLQSAIGNLLSVSNQFPELKFTLDPLLRELEDLQRPQRTALRSRPDDSRVNYSRIPVALSVREPSRSAQKKAVRREVPEDYRKVEQLPFGTR